MACVYIHGPDPTVKQITPKFKAKDKFKCFCIKNSAITEAITSIPLETEPLKTTRKKIKNQRFALLHHWEENQGLYLRN